MKYLIIDGYSINEVKGIARIFGRKIENDFPSTVGKEIDTVIIPTKILNPTKDNLGKVLNVEYNKNGYIRNAKVDTL